MALEISVGSLASIRQDEPDLYAEYSDLYSSLERALERRGITGYREPITLAKKDYWQARLGYSAIHTLRRYAAYANLRNARPDAPSSGRASQDSVIQEYVGIYETQFLSGSLKGLFQRLWPATRLRFNHLLVHSDADGFYAPVDFRNVVMDDSVQGSMIGSSQQLQRECLFLAEQLLTPLNLDPTSKGFDKAFADAQKKLPANVRAFGEESCVCLVLYHAAKHSIATGSAIHFG